LGRFFPVELKATIIEYQGHSRTCRCCGKVTQAKILPRFAAVFPALWTFVVEQGVEPTNNHIHLTGRVCIGVRRNALPLL
jgi:hypothetical protein